MEPDGQAQMLQDARCKMIIIEYREQVHTLAHDESHVKPRKRVTVRILTDSLVWRSTSPGFNESSELHFARCSITCWSLLTSLILTYKGTARYLYEKAG
jgi:hypothetical protein